MLNAGSLTEIVTLQQTAVRRDSTGDVLQEWQTIAQTRASIRFLKGSRALIFGDVWNPTTIVVTVRYSKQFVNATRVLWEGKPFTVISANPDRVNGSVTITADLYNEGQEVNEIE